jgi:hypothetical protein
MRQVSGSADAMLKDLLFRGGRHLTTRSIERLEALTSYVVLGRVLGRYGLADAVRVESEEAIFDVAVSLLPASYRLLYLEFGVYRGDSMQHWLRAIPRHDAQFYGFDSFLGLPEHWHEGAPRGHYSANGEQPTFDDGRVTLVEGWFDETVPRFELPPHDVLFVNIDSDLYSSATTVLGRLKHEFHAGDFLYFDELNSHNHELRALREFLDDTKASVTAVATNRTRTKWLFRFLDPTGCNGTNA